MSDQVANLPPEQKAIRDKCFHPSGTFVEFPIEDVETSIPERFEKIVQMYPNQVAVRADGEQITYDTLNRCANRLARAIIAQRGTGQEPVALYIEEGIPLIVAFLASLKAGKFVLRLDPSTAPTRTDHIMDDSGASIILTNARNAPMAHHWTQRGRQLLEVNDEASSLSDENVKTTLSSNDFAYINYTSGSTGRAKGNLKSHSFLLHNVSNFANAGRICAHDSLAVFGRYPVGIHTFHALLTGSTQCLVEKEASFFGICDWLIEEAITVVISMPTAFRNFLATVAGRCEFPALRLIRLGGEPLRASDFELYKAQFSSECLLVNSYSSQETGTVSFYFADRDTKILGSHVPVGYVLEGVKVSILDDVGNLAGPDQTGEIVVTSSFLSSGYWRNGELTSEHLLSVSDDRQSDSVYHTGDIGQLSGDGCLVHLGRKDSRIKIRGFRVDVNECEEVLSGHPGVKELSITDQQDSAGDTQLIAFIVPNERSRPVISELRLFIREKLPDYMIPSKFVFLTALPRTPTGKIDRRSLTVTENSRPELDVAFVAPRTFEETRLAEIWAEVLSLDQVGIHDNFFDLGGHSLAASRVISRVIQTFKLELPVKALFEAPTVAEMAAIIAQNQTKQASDIVLAQMLREVEAMTEEEAQRQLAKEGTRS